MRFRSRAKFAPRSISGQNYFRFATAFPWTTDTFYQGPEGSVLRDTCADVIGSYNSANPFHTYSVARSRDIIAKVFYDDGPHYKYDGEIAVRMSLLTPPILVENTLQDLQAWGAKAAARSRILRPAFDLPVTIGELAELRQLVGGIGNFVKRVKETSKTKKHAIERIDSALKGTGETGLWYTFGVVPTYQAIQDARALYGKLDLKARQLAEKDGKWKYVGVDLLDSTVETTSELSYPVEPFGVNSQVPHENSGTVTSYRKERIWFSGWTKLDLGLIPEDSRHSYLKKRLLGGPISGRLLYELTPFSWLLDWATSYGAVVTNWDDFAVTQWRRPCIMHESIAEDRYRCLLRYHNAQGTPVESRPSATVRVHVQRREPWVSNSIGYAFGGLDKYKASVLGFLALKQG